MFQSTMRNSNSHNDAVSTPEIIQRWKTWEYDHELTDKDLEGGGSGLYDGTIPAFAWREQENRTAIITAQIGSGWVPSKW